MDHISNMRNTAIIKSAKWGDIQKKQNNVVQYILYKKIFNF